MTFFAPSTRIVLHSNLCPEECARRLGQAIDPEDFTVFSLSNYRGTKTFLGKVEGLRFRLFRRGYRNIPTVLSAEFLAQGKGSRIEGAFDLDPTTKKLLRIVSLAGVFLLMLAAVNAVRTHTLLPWMVVGIACIYITTVLLGPKILRMIGPDQEREIADFLCTKLEAGEDSSAFGSGRKP